MKKLLLVITIIILTLNIQIAAKAQSTCVQFIAYGDSNTRGYRGANDPKIELEETYVALTANKFVNSTFINAGRGGFTAKDLVQRVQNKVVNKYIDGCKNIMLMMIGTNDYAVSRGVGETFKDIKKVHREVKKAGFDVYMLTYPPMLGDTKRNHWLERLNSRVVNNAQAKGYTVSDIYNRFSSRPEFYLSDKLHLSPAGQREISINILKTFNTKTPEFFQQALNSSQVV